MKRTSVVLLLCAILATVVQSTLALGQSEKSSKLPALYERIGGSLGIGKIFDEVGGRMAADPLLAKFFQGQSAEALMAQRNRAVEFLCRETGGPCAYSGRALKQVHGSLAITEAQWKAFMKHLTETLDNQKVGEKEKSEFIAVVKRFRGDVVAKK
jgi:hemoglobin